MDAPREDEFLLLKDEKFDFDISLSSSSSNEDEDDEVFFGPVGHRERCVAARVEQTPQAREEPAPPAGGGWPWSPLAGDAFVEVYKEAHLLALQIESARKAAPALPAPALPAPALPALACSPAGERFVQEPGSKLSLFEKEKERESSPQSLKRETFCVGDGPSLLPLAPARPAVPVGPTPSQPPSQTAAQRRGRTLPRTALRHATLEKELPASLSQMEPPGDPQFRRPRAARDSASLQGSGTQAGPAKRSLPVLHKGLRKTLPNPPSLARMSSTSGPASSASSRPCGVRASHAATGQDGGRLLAAPERPRPPVPAGPSCGQSEGAAEPARTPRTPARRSLSCSSQAPRTGAARRRESSLGPRMGVSTLAEPFKVPGSPASEPPASAVPPFPQRPQPHTPAGRAPLHSTPAPSSVTRTPSATRRLSALPTPASRRLSSLPRATPRTTLRAPASPPLASARRLSSQPQRKSPLRTGPAWESSGHAASSGSDASPDGSCSPPAAVPQALRFSPEQSGCPKGSPAGEAPEQVQLPEALLVDIRQDELTVGPRVGGTPLQDVPLIDLRSTPEAGMAPGSRCESRALLDLLVNMPDCARSNTPKPRPGPEAVQLIDLTSPLIQLSPEVDKENVASPLLKF